MSAEAAGSGGLRRAALLALVFFALQLPSLFDVTRYHGDERFYTDAAIGMVQTGDVLTPRYPDGSIRSEKPVLSYLVLVGSYELLGISLFSSRLPFLAAGALLVFLTWRLGRQLLHDDEAAFLAAAIVASCPDIILLSIRSTPDILLCLFLMVGFSGFAVLVRGEGEMRPAAARAWLGAGMAMAAKGGLGAVLVVYAGAAAALRKGRVAALGRLVHPLFTPAGMLLALGGFGAYAVLHGGQVLARSVDDQVTGRIVTADRYVGQVVRYAIMAAEHLAPWVALTVVCALRDRQGRADVWQRHRFLLGFTAGWGCLLVLIFGAGDVVRGRYLAAGYPMLALALAAVLAGLAQRGLSLALVRGIVATLLAVAALVGAALAAGGSRIGAGLVIAGASVGGVAAIGAVLARRGRPTSPLVWFAITALVAQTLAASAIRATFSRTPVTTIAARLASEEFAGARVAQVGDSAHLASKLRVATGGRVSIDGYQRAFSTPDWALYDVVISDMRPPDAVISAGFRVEACGEAWGDDWSLDEILAVVRADDPAEALARRSAPYWIATRARTPQQRMDEHVPGR